MRVLVIIPAYNEAMNIEKTVQDLQDHSPSVDYLIVNDGSKDNTKEVLNQNDFNYIDCFLNLGLAGAMQLGFKYACENGYDAAVQFDGDGQHCAVYIESLASRLEAGSNVVIGSRYVTEKKPWTARMIGSRLIGGAIKIITGKTLTDPTSGFRIYDRQVMVEMAYKSNMPPEPDTMVYLLREGYKIDEVQVKMRDREYGESYLNLANTIQYMTRMMVSILMIQSFRKVGN